MSNATYASIASKRIAQSLSVGLENTEDEVVLSDTKNDSQSMITGDDDTISNDETTVPSNLASAKSEVPIKDLKRHQLHHVNLKDANAVTTNFQICDSDHIEVTTTSLSPGNIKNSEKIVTELDTSISDNTAKPHSYIAFSNEQSEEDSDQTSHARRISDEIEPHFSYDNNPTASTKLNLGTAGSSATGRDNVQISTATSKPFSKQSSRSPRRVYSMQEKINSRMHNEIRNRLSRTATETNLLLDNNDDRSREINQDRINSGTLPGLGLEVKTAYPLGRNNRGSNVANIDKVNPQIFQSPIENKTSIASDNTIHSKFRQASARFKSFKNNGQKISNENDRISTSQDLVDNSDDNNYSSEVSIGPNDEVTDKHTLKLLSVLQDVKQHENDYEKKRDELKNSFYELKTNYKKCGLAVGIGLTMATTIMSAVGFPPLAYFNEPIQATESELPSQYLDSNSMSSIDSDSDANIKKRQENEWSRTSIEDDEDNVNNRLKVRPKRGRTNIGLFEGIKANLKMSSSDEISNGHNTKEITSEFDEFPFLCDSLPSTFPGFAQDKRTRIVLELYETEYKYVAILETLIEVFKKPLLGILEPKEISMIFGNIESIFDLNIELLTELQKYLLCWSEDQRIGLCFLKRMPRFIIYIDYCNNYDNAEAAFKQNLRKKKDFEELLNVCYNHSRCQKSLQLPSYLITPVQRIPRYLLLFKDLIDKTDESHVDYEDLSQVLLEMEELAGMINTSLMEVQGKKAMAGIQSSVIGLQAFNIENRTLIKDGEVYLISNKKPYRCLLFNDLLIFAIHGSKKLSAVELVFDLDVIWFEDLCDLDPQTTIEDAIEIYNPERSFTMYTKSKDEKKLWLQALNEALIARFSKPAVFQLSGMPRMRPDIKKRKVLFTYKDGSTYDGEYCEGRRHGYGEMTWANNSNYIGYWVDDQRAGHGEMSFNTLEIYKGHWKDDQPDGEGALYFPSGTVVSTTWIDGRKFGRATVKFGNGDVFEGMFIKNEFEGHGKLVCKAFVYNGEWKNSKWSGRGKLLRKSGDHYSGDFVDNTISGFGEMNYCNGSKYTGEWKNNLFHGQGTFETAEYSYEGSWHIGQKQGKGKIRYSNGECYDGDWKCDKKWGHGITTFSNGNKYDGEYQQNHIYGLGKMVYASGESYDGEWVYEQFHGMGTYKYLDGSVYSGSWQNGYRCGDGKLTMSNDNLYDGGWKNDKFHGLGTLSMPLCEYSYEGNWVDGKRCGEGTEISVNGTYSGYWKENLRHGEGIEQCEGIYYEGYWNMDKKIGKGTLRYSEVDDVLESWVNGESVEYDGKTAFSLPVLIRHDINEEY
ncbi:Phosphatidylinositol 4-phosphate 5-kinase 8 [Trichoplax sp. H2]|nr:Phosphatidylinositol 4-phosphate 5-kinase 8 [Trichoplax sp. H2]|eukprot:RDD47087.1 Phosphatidylinositol 4-phosphate 5-kinase 8 [Trichoplax sp. H2]